MIGVKKGFNTLKERWHMTTKETFDKKEKIIINIYKLLYNNLNLWELLIQDEIKNQKQAQASSMCLMAVAVFDSYKKPYSGQKRINSNATWYNTSPRSSS